MQWWASWRCLMFKFSYFMLFLLWGIWQLTIGAGWTSFLNTRTWDKSLSWKKVNDWHRAEVLFASRHWPVICWKICFIKCHSHFPDKSLRDMPDSFPNTAWYSVQITDANTTSLLMFLSTEVYTFPNTSNVYKAKRGKDINSLDRKESHCFSALSKYLISLLE